MRRCMTREGWMRGTGVALLLGAAVALSGCAGAIIPDGDMNWAAPNPKYTAKKTTTVKPPPTYTTGHDC